MTGAMRSLSRCHAVKVLRLTCSAFAVLALVGTAGAATSAAGSGPRTYVTHSTLPLHTALVDPFAFNGDDQATAFSMARSAGASYIRFVVPWAQIAPAAPAADFVPTDPASSYYAWSWLDTSIAAIEANGMTPILDIGFPPGWSLVRQNDGLLTGVPSASALGDFAKALALRYDGFHGEPPVHIYQVWNEPNLSLDLSPPDPTIYRAMVNAVADSVHAVDPRNLVVAGALDPFGHPKSTKQKWYSVAPLAFMRSVLCLSKGSKPHSTCHDPVHFDVWAHHPYSFGGAFGKADKPDNIQLGDLSRMRTLLRAGVRLHHVVSDHSVQFWVTECGWDTNPPRQGAASLGLASRWTAESLFQAWRSGISLFTWFDLQDQPGVSPYQSGLYFHASSLSSARPKPVLTAFRFPFVAYLHRSTVSVWGRDATSDKRRVAVQLRHGKSGRWRTVAYVLANRYGIYRAKLKLKASKKDWLRASASGSGRSLAFSLKVPRRSHIGAWGGVPPSRR